MRSKFWKKPLRIIGAQIIITIMVSSFLSSFSCSKKAHSVNNGDTTSAAASDMSFWLTKGDQSVLLQKQNTSLSFSTNSNAYPFIDVDSTQIFQTIDRQSCIIKRIIRK
jgi:glucosylceramidase